MASNTPCPREIGLFYACLLRQPEQNWECADDGVAAIREGYCDAEQQAVIACMNTKVAQ